MCVLQANSRLKQIEKEYTQKLAKSSQVSMSYIVRPISNQQNKTDFIFTSVSLCVPHVFRIPTETEAGEAPMELDSSVVVSHLTGDLEPNQTRSL